MSMLAAAYTCVSLLVAMSSIVVTDIKYPQMYYEDTSNKIAIRNLSCSRVDIYRIDGYFQESSLVMELPEAGNTADCIADAYFAGIYMGNLEVKVSIERIFLNMLMTSDEPCLTNDTYVEECTGAVKATSIKATSGNVFYNIALAAARPIINTQLKNYFCNSVVPSIAAGLKDHHSNNPEQLPKVVSTDTPVTESSLITSLMDIVGSLPPIMGAKVSASAIAANVIQVNASFSDPFDIQLFDLTIPTRLPIGVPRAIAEDELVVRFLANLATHMDNFMKIDAKPLVEGEPLVTVKTPAGATVSFELWMQGFSCTSDVECVVARDNGISLHNVRGYNLGDFNSLITNIAAPVIQDEFNAVMKNTLSSFPNSTVPFISLSHSPIVHTPPVPITVLVISLMTISAIGATVYGVVQHIEKPMQNRKGPLSVVRVVVEDGILCFFAFGTMALFAWSNSTTAASLQLGGKSTLYTFSLWGTVQDLWHSGLQPLAVLVFIFSGVYPYVKLLVIIVCTVILRRPQTYMLAIVDLIGKFSLVDSFVMMIMVSGLEVKGLADIKMFASFYIFLVATVLSILIGNYGIYLWRYDTDVRAPRSGHHHSLIFEEEEIDEGSANENKFPKQTRPRMNTYSETPASPRRGLDLGKLFEERIKAIVLWWSWWATAVFFVAITGLGVVAWVVPAFRYKFGGVAVLLVGDHKDMTLWDMGLASHWAVFLLAFLTVFVAPCLYALFYNYAPFLASWCASDVMIAACCGGLWQLETFISFVIGEDLQDIYSASADLLWPLALLAASVLFQWFLIARQVLVEVIDEDDDYEMEQRKLLFRGTDGGEGEEVQPLFTSNERSGGMPFLPSYAAAEAAHGKRKTVEAKTTAAAGEAPKEDHRTAAKESKKDEGKEAEEPKQSSETAQPKTETDRE